MKRWFVLLVAFLYKIPGFLQLMTLAGITHLVATRVLWAALARLDVDEWLCRRLAVKLAKRPETAEVFAMGKVFGCVGIEACDAFIEGIKQGLMSAVPERRVEPLLAIFRSEIYKAWNT